jgi:CheY-like chemotaxis protein
MAAQRVLVVDDDPDLAENIAEIVGSLGVETEVAGSRRGGARARA